MRSVDSSFLLLALAVLGLLVAIALPGCDLFGSDDGDPGVEGVPPERLVAMVAVYDETTDDGAPSSGASSWPTSTTPSATTCSARPATT